MNNIIEFLNICDDDIEEYKTEIRDDTRIIYVRKKLRPVYCPVCGYRMHSKGMRTKEVRHPIFQDGYKLIIALSYRRWECSNKECGEYLTDTFTFVEKDKSISNLTPFMILDSLKELTRTAASVAKQFNVSDTYVHNLVLTHLDFKPLKMPRILSVDEVYLEFTKKDRYCLVLLDFESGEIVDILPNRYKETLDNYFYSIERKQRDNVEVVICDMYGPYLDFPENYFHKACVIVDSFHCVSFLIRSINNYIGAVLKRYQEKDRKRLEEKNIKTNSSNKTIKESAEVKMLKNYRFFLLKNDDDIEHSNYVVYRKRFATYYSTNQLEKKFMALDSRFPKIKELKEEYIHFNSEYFGKDPNEIRNKLNELIKKYKESGIYIFIDFAEHLERFEEQIIASFKDYDVPVKSKEREELHRRLSNGPMEGFNRKPKDLKRTSRGFDNFEYTRNRILWSERSNAHVLAVPKKLEEVQTKTGKKRGPYNKE